VLRGSIPLYSASSGASLARLLLQDMPELTLELVEVWGFLSLEQLLSDVNLFGKLLQLQGDPGYAYK
jgi:hypothetical protein